MPPQTRKRPGCIPGAPITSEVEPLTTIVAGPFRGPWRSRPMMGLRALRPWPYPAPLGPLRPAGWRELYCDHGAPWPAACQRCGRLGAGWWVWRTGEVVELADEAEAAES